ncbi:MAG: pseudouridine synthase [Deltaproteobacteria bacterium]
MADAIEFTLDAEHADDRWDRAIRAALVARGHDASVREIRAGLKANEIQVGGRRVAAGDRAEAGAVVVIRRTLRAQARVRPDASLLDRVVRIHEDDELLVLAKPSGLPTTPVHPDEIGTLLNAAVALCPAIADAGPPLEGGAVHRLDTATSGVVLFAKTKRARAELREAFRAHRVEKVYDAIVDGDLDAVFANGAVTVEAGIVNAGPRVRVGDGPDALPARSRVERAAGATRGARAHDDGTSASAAPTSDHDTTTTRSRGASANAAHRYATPKDGAPASTDGAAANAHDAGDNATRAPASSDPTTGRSAAHHDATPAGKAGDATGRTRARRATPKAHDATKAAGTVGASASAADGDMTTDASPSFERRAVGLVCVTTRFGRRHQVRVHLAHLGLPILGDTTYGGTEAARLALHARRLVLADGRVFEAPWPDDLRRLLRQSQWPA